jgi:hypothetical protein
VPEPKEPFVERAPSLFLSSSEIIHSKRDPLQFHALVKLLEVHDFSPLELDSNDKGDDGGTSVPGSR